MFKPAHLTVAQVQQPRPADPAMAQNVFKVLHGYYGNLFASKFATGQIIEHGEDKGQDAGVMSAMAIWAHGLRNFDAGTVKAALRQCQERHAEFPPSLPQFVALCAANKPRETHALGPRAIGMSDQLRSVYARRAREVIAKHEAKAVTVKTGYIELPPSLDGLKQAIANAVACAGGDEVATLVRLDREIAPRRAA